MIKSYFNFIKMAGTSIYPIIEQSCGYLRRKAFRKRQHQFGGTLSAGHEVTEVKRNLASLFKTDDTKIDQLFT